MRAFAAVLLLVVLTPIAPLGAQQGSCTIDQPASGTVTRRVEGGSTVIDVQEVVVLCEGGTEIRANEGAVYQQRGETHLRGNVVFQDTARRLTSDNAVYTSGAGRLYATGDVVFTEISSGSTLRGPNLEYFRPMEGRPEARLIATQRPHLTLIPGNVGDARDEPIEIDADRTTIIGDTMTATGSVVIGRSDFDAWANEARYDRTTGRLDLRQQARVEGEEFELTGEHIQAMIPEGGIESLVSRTDATLVGEEIRVESPELRLFFEDDLLQRLVAVRGGTGDTVAVDQPAVTATGFRLEADSIEALSPGQQLEQVIAIGTARGEVIDTASAPAPAPPAAQADTAGGAADTTRLALADAGVMDRDWITGDTVIGYFAPAPDTTMTVVLPDSAAALPDTASAAETAEAGEGDIQLQRMVAKGSARSLYRLYDHGAEDTARPALNYLSGETIELRFAAGELDMAQVSGLRRGLYLDPIPLQPEEAGPGESENGAQTAGAAGERR